MGVLLAGAQAWRKPNRPYGGVDLVVFESVISALELVMSWWLTASR